jgi:NADH-quinone oxidoreductase B subunit
MDLVKWARVSSPWIIHFNAGACNGCDIEVLAALTPKFDMERFGMLLKASPRHGDVLVVTGAVTLQVRDRLLRIYEQMPEPKFVLAVGSCACSGGVFRGCYSVEDGLDTYLPVDIFVAGCPPKPEAVIDGALKLLRSLESQK